MEMQLRVAHLINTLNCGGCENMLVRTLPVLSREFDQLVLTLTSPGELTPQLVARGVPVIGLDWRGDPADFRFMWRLRRMIKDFRPDLIVTYLYQADFIGRSFLRLMGAPVVPFLRTTYNFERFDDVRRVERLTTSLVRSYFATSTAVKDYYVEQIGVRGSKITVIPNGVDVSAFENADGASLAPSLGLPATRFVIVCVANLAPYKGHRFLLEAFEQTAAVHPEALLLLVGKGEEAVRLSEQVSNYRAKERVMFLGRRFDVPEILKLADLFVLPTVFEGMSNALLEAMAAGLAVITTDIPENRAVVTDSVNGRLVAPSDADGLQRAMSSLIVDGAQRQRLGKQAKRHIQDRFSLSAVAALWSQAIRREARRSRRGWRGRGQRASQPATR